METTAESARPFQFFVKLIDGKTSVLNFAAPRVDALAVKRRIFEVARIPVPSQRLIVAGRQLEDRSVVSSPGPTLHLSLRLRGGKGGFGSLLRGAATKAGQKKTNNFDACRDMSGRRLRHVNAEKKLEEWRAEEEERKLERVAEEFIKKAAKKGKKGVGEGQAEKYVEKYRQQSAKCVAQVEECVRDVIGSRGTGSKRKAGVGSGSDAKKLKIWMGKRKVGDSDSDDSGDDTSEDEEDEKSTISNGAMHLNLIREEDGSSDSVTGGRQDGEAYTSSCNGSGSEEEKESSMQVCSESDGCSGGVVPDEKVALVNPVSSEGHAVLSLECAIVSETEAVEPVNESQHKVEPENCEVVVSQSPSAPDSGDEVTTEAGQVSPQAGGFSEDKVAVTEAAEIVEPEIVEASVSEDNALDFDKFNSAAEMEGVGMERLKLELQSRGLKCGGTLQERASRLFLLKTTPLDKIPKKHLAKK
ncbi:replication stress response regulator SDE2 [Eucalyptus grandis]|uniref:replication stress response regulator SDE2 n=1 Tax=Eucalyptus grandis TaxID=71139 RepID=UPI00192EEE6F|nr:replication stress response regulator SDE2 [Eucalyptus grandis]